MSESELTAEQWCALDLAIDAGVTGMTRGSLLEAEAIPQGARMKLMWALLTMPDGLLDWSESGQRFRATQSGRDLFERRFGVRSLETSAVDRIARGLHAMRPSHAEDGEPK